MASGTNDRLRLTLARLAPDPTISKIVARAVVNGASSEVVADISRGAAVIREHLSQRPDELHQFIVALLGDGITSGAVAFGDLVGLAALPPVASTPLLVLRRPAPLRLMPDATAPCLLTPALGLMLATLLRRGSGVVLAGPIKSRTSEAMGALARLLPASTAIAVVEPTVRIAPDREALRLRALPSDARRALGDVVLMIDLPDPPMLVSCPPPVVLAVHAKTPQGALSRLRGPGTRLTPADAVLWAETAPALIWHAHTPKGPRIEAVWELLPRLDHQAELPRLQMLLGRDQGSGALIPTGATPVDPVFGDAWRTAATRPSYGGSTSR